MEQTQNTTTQPVQTVDGPATDQTDQPQEKGVLRLLQEGHFKGVADLRLRINFFDELAAINKAQVEAVANEKVAGVVDTVAAVVDAFLTDNQLTEQQADTLQQLHVAFVLGAEQSQQDPVPMLKNAFEAFLEMLQSTLMPPAAEEEPIAGEQTGEGPDVGSAQGSQPTPAEHDGPDWQGLIENLRAAFTAALQELTDGLASVTVLPDLSEPNGNGVAYDKFLAIYNQMMAAPAVGTSAEGTDSVG